MWEIKGKSVNTERFSALEPLRVLNYYDGPRIFTIKDADDELCLACWSDEDEDKNVTRFLIVETTDQIVADLDSSILSVREALAQPQVWVVDWAWNCSVAAVWLVQPEDVPDDSQPQPRTMLHRSLKPALPSLAVGEGSAEIHLQRRPDPACNGQTEKNGALEVPASSTPLT